MDRSTTECRTNYVEWRLVDVVLGAVANACTPRQIERGTFGAAWPAHTTAAATTGPPKDTDAGSADGIEAVVGSNEDAS